MATLNPVRVTPQAHADSLPGHEPPFWQRAGAVWRQLAGSFSRDGFSFEWHELQPPANLKWANSFHPASVEICLNLRGCGWVVAEDARMDFGPDTAAFFVTDGGHLKAQRLAGQHHQFLSVEFSLPFLQHRLAFGLLRARPNPEFIPDSPFEKAYLKVERAIDEAIGLMAA